MIVVLLLRNYEFCFPKFCGKFNGMDENHNRLIAEN